MHPHHSLQMTGLDAPCPADTRGFFPRETDQGLQTEPSWRVGGGKARKRSGENLQTAGDHPLLPLQPCSCPKQEISPSREKVK